MRVCDTFNLVLDTSDWLAHISIFSVSFRFTDWLKTLNMKPCEISESHLSLFEVSMENKDNEDYKPEKKVADNWQRTDTIHIYCKCVWTIV